MSLTGDDLHYWEPPDDPPRPRHVLPAPCEACGGDYGIPPSDPDEEPCQACCADAWCDWRWRQAQREGR